MGDAARRWIELVPASEHFWAARLVEAWGYPRGVTEREVEQGAWFRYSDGSGIAWVVPAHESLVSIVGEHAYCFHGIGSPAARSQRGRVLSPRAATFIEGWAEILGARRLYSLVPDETPDVPAAAMRRYLRCYGYSSDRYGSVKELGEVIPWTHSRS